MEILSPAEAANRILEGRTDEVFLLLSDFAKFTGMSELQVITELRSGRLEASGVSDGHGGYRDVCITAHDTIRYRALMLAMN